MQCTPKRKLAKLSLITTEKKILQDFGNSPNFCDILIEIFTEKEYLYGTALQGVDKW
jgi:hypothetical protein